MKLYPELLFKMDTEIFSGERKKLLVIDDDELFLKSIETVLSDEYELNTSADPAIVSDWLSQQRYDAVIIDYNMEPFNGIELIRKIRKMDLRTGIILITGYGTFELASEAMSLGVSALLSKPVQIPLLKEAIRTAIQERYFIEHLDKMDSLSESSCVSHHVLDTQRREIEKLKDLLRWTYKQLEGTFNIVPYPIMILDKDLRIISLNQAAVAQIGKPQSELVGRFCFEVFGKNGNEDCTDCPSRRALSIGLPTHSMFSEKPDQPKYLVSAVPIVDDFQQKLINVIEMRHLAQPYVSLAEGSRVLTNLNGKLNAVTEMHHEMNNMLTILLTVSEVIKLSVEKEQWNRVKETVPLLVENINRMINYLKALTSKDQPSQPHIISVPEFIGGLIETIRTQPLYKHIRFDKFWPETDIRIKANEVHFQEILINLFKNAAEAMESGYIRVSADACPAEQRVRIKIADNGPGIPETLLPHLFEEKITTKRNGNGYGLLIVKRLLEQNNGTVHVNLRKEGGTEFILNFPAILNSTQTNHFSY